MGFKLLNYVKLLTGFTPAEKSVLKELADLSRDDQTVFISLEKLSLYTGYSVRSLQYTLRRIEQKQTIILQDESRGRGYIHRYRFNVGYKSPVEESTPVVPPEHIPPSTNGHMTDAYRPHDPYKPEPLTREQIEARKAKQAAARARIAEKPRPERKLHDRPGRLARERTGMVSGPDSLDGYSGGDETP